VKCTLCGYEFNEKDAERACKGCPVAKGCALLKCPNCGFEMAAEPRWLKNLMKKREGNSKKE